MDLKIDPDDLNTCVQCGLCLSSCPTFRVTGDETMSPRGRIALMREVQNNDAPLTPEVVRSFESCVQCRGCEPACPSSVPYGSLIEQTRETLAKEGTMTPKWLRVALEPLSHPRLLRMGRVALASAQKVRAVPGRLGLPDGLNIREAPLEASGSDVYMFTGCVMDAMQRDVHRATQRVLEAAGFGVMPTNDSAPCCGALHSHAGLVDKSRKHAATVMDAIGGESPIIVNSAGCGAAMKDYGHLLGTPEAVAFSARVFDACEFIAEHIDKLPAAQPLDLRVAVQDPCHLRHVQKVHEKTRTSLRPYVRELVELDDDGLCCGAGGAYSMLEPSLAGEIRERKLASIERAVPDLVASANPGCSMHLGAKGVKTIHPVQVVDAAITGVDPRSLV